MSDPQLVTDAEADRLGIACDRVQENLPTAADTRLLGVPVCEWLDRLLATREALVGVLDPFAGQQSRRYPTLGDGQRAAALLAELHGDRA